MPTNKPRVNVVMEQDVYDVISEFCKLSKRSMSSFLAQSAEDSVPFLSKLIPLLRLTDSMNEETRLATSAVLERLNSDLESGISSLMLNAVPSIANRPSDCDEEQQSGFARVLPPSINKGVRFSEKEAESKDKSNIYSILEKMGKGR